MRKGEALIVHPDLWRASEGTAQDLAASPGRTLFGRRHLAFSDLVNALGRSVGRLPVSRLTLRLVLKTLLVERRDDDRWVHWTDPLLRLFLRLDLMPLSRRGDELFGLLPGGERRFMAELYAAWRQNLKRRGLFTPGDALSAWLLARPTPRPTLLETAATLDFTGFEEFAPLEIETLDRLSESYSVRLHVSWLHAHAAGLFAPLSAMLDAVERLAQGGRLDIEFSEPGSAQDPEREAWIAALSGAEDSRSATALSEPLRHLEALTRQGQVRLVAREVKTLLAAGCSPEDIVIVTPDLETLRPALRRAILEEGLPLSYHRSVPLMNTPPMRVFHRLTEILDRGLTPLDLVILAREAAPFGFGPGNEEGAPTLLQAEALLRARRVERFEDISSVPEDDALAPFLPVLSSWRIWCEGFADSRPLADWVAVLLEALCLARPPAFSSPHDARHFALSWHALETVKGILREWQDGGLLDKSAPFSGEPFLAWLHSTLSASIQVRSSSEPEAVMVLSPFEAAGRQARHLFFLDLNDGVFPSGGTSHQVLNDGERVRLNGAASALLLPGQSDTFLRERMAFCRLLLNSERITLLSARLDHKGEALPQSAFLVALRPFAKGLATDEAREFEGPSARENWLLRCAGSAFWDDAEPPKTDVAMVAAARRVRDKAIVESLRRQPDSTESGLVYNGRLCTQTLNGMRLPERFTPHHFESYAGCPFRFLLETLLDLDPWKEPGLGPDAMQLGSAVHFALERLVRATRPGVTPDLEALESDAARLVEESLRYLEGGASPKAAPFFARIAQKLAVRIRRYFELWWAETETAPPWRLECSFGRDKTDALLPELALEADEAEPVRLSGRIDRIDLGGGLMRLIDYKTSRSRGLYPSLLRSENFGKTSFQMPIYLLAVKRAAELGLLPLPVKRIEPCYALIGKPSDRVIPPVKEQAQYEMDGAFFRDYFETDRERRLQLKALGHDTLADQLCALVAAMRQGCFEPEAGPVSCPHCSFPAVCRAVKSTTTEESKESEDAHVPA